MNLVLPPFIEQLIEDRVRSGRYQTPGDVVAAAVAQLDVQERTSDGDAGAVDPADAEELLVGGNDRR